MIVFINIQDKTVDIFSEKGLEKIAFSEISVLSAKLYGKKVLYITNAKECKGEDVVSLVSKIDNVKDTVKNTVVNTGPKKPEKMFVRATTKKIIAISDLNLKDEKGLPRSLIFAGEYDCKLMSEVERLNFSSSLQAKRLLENGTLQIIPESVALVLIKEGIDKKLNSKKDDVLVVGDGTSGSAAKYRDDLKKHKDKNSVATRIGRESDVIELGDITDKTRMGAASNESRLHEG